VKEREWLVLNYTLPKEPSRVRVSAWRKLKKCGSVNVGQSMWLLPRTEENVGILKEISNEILQNNGEAYILKADFVGLAGPDAITGVFNRARDEEYAELLDKCKDFFREIEKETEKRNFTFGELEENEEEYYKLVEWFKKIAARDFFSSSMKGPANQELEKCKETLDDFSNKVYELNDRV